jgi:hypothetical protein
MPVYEFLCPKGHESEDLVTIGTKHWPCAVCSAEIMAKDYPWPLPRIPMATRILSATRTDFEFADQRRKRSFT